jgi:hypothetical protein
MSDHARKKLLEHRNLIVGLNSTAVRLIGLCLRDKHENLIDEAACGVKAAIKGLENFAGIAGCDSGTEYITIALRQMVGWMERRDVAAARKAFNERYETSNDAFISSMNVAFVESGFFPVQS